MSSRNGDIFMLVGCACQLFSNDDPFNSQCRVHNVGCLAQFLFDPTPLQLCLGLFGSIQLLVSTGFSHRLCFFALCAVNNVPSWETFRMHKNFSNFLYMHKITYFLIHLHKN